jgi:hypothetical protein
MLKMIIKKGEKSLNKHGFFENISILALLTPSSASRERVGRLAGPGEGKPKNTTSLVNTALFKNPLYISSTNSISCKTILNYS